MDLFKPVTAPLATNEASDLEAQLKSKAGGSLIMGLKLIQSQSPMVAEGKAQVGDWFLGNVNLGKKLKCVIGPWRYHAQRLMGGKVDKEDFNLTPKSLYNAATNEWSHPDGFTPGFEEISDKHVPDNQAKQIVNRAGFDVLLYLIDQKQFTTLFLHKTAISMTDTFEILKSHRGSVCILEGQVLKTSSFRWQGPKVSIHTDKFSIPEDKETEEIVNKFLSPGIVYNPEQKENVRPR